MSKTLIIDDNTARRIYPSAASELKSILEETYSKEFFSAPIMNRVKSLGDVCREKGLNTSDPRYTIGDPDEIAYRVVKDATSLLNEGWIPNWDDANERKWFIWWYMNKPGFRLSDFDYDWASSNSSASSRFCFKSEELAKHASQYFKSYYEQLMTI